MTHAVYLAIFLAFCRKVMQKVHVDVPENLKAFSNDSSGCWNVCLYSAPIAYSYDKGNAMLLAAAIMERFPAYSKWIGLVEDEDLDTYAPGMIPQIRYDDHMVIKNLIEEFECGY